MQTITSANTSINKNKVPSIYNNKKAVSMIFDKKVIDIGGGKFDNAVEYAKNNYNTNVSVYDKYNRDSTHNEEVLSNNYDIAIISNVLNVINDIEARLEVVKLALSKASTILITVYEGNGDNIAKVTGNDMFQLNRKTIDYISELEMIDNVEVTRYGKLIVVKSI